MELYLFNVGFGECCLLKQNNDNLLVDFGSDSGDKQRLIAQTTSKIQQLCGEQPLSVLLTHFHNDHINGLTTYLNTISQTPANVPFMFQTFYIPDIFAQNYSNAGIGYIHLFLLKDIFDAIIIRKKPVISLYELLKAFVNNKSHIEFLKRGDTFKLSDIDFDVLWPCFECITIHKKTINRTINTLAQLNFISVPTRLGYDTVSGDGTISLGIVDEFAQQLSDAFLRLRGNGTVSQTTMDQLEKTFKEIENQCTITLVPNQTVTASYLRSLGNSLVNEANKLSIVFQDTGTPQFSKLLMTGDIPKTELRKLVTKDKAICSTLPQIKEQYKLIKAPHHGTQSHFISIFPKCEIITASNGSTSHAKWGKIAFEYGALYASNRHIKMLCTNPRCELVELARQGKGVQCSDCPKTIRPYYFVHL